VTVFLIVLLVILGIIAVALFSPVSVKLGLDDDFYFSVSFLSFTLYDSKKPRVKKKKKKRKKSEKPAKKAPPKKEKKDNLFKKLYKKRGFKGTINELCRVAKFAISKCGKALKRFSFEKISLDIKVATDNAADTAILYGMVCSGVYPIVTFLNTVVGAKFKKVDIRSDFESQSPELTFDFLVRCRVIWLLIFAIQIFKEYNEFIRRNELYE